MQTLSESKASRSSAELIISWFFVHRTDFVGKFIPEPLATCDFESPREMEDLLATYCNLMHHRVVGIVDRTVWVLNLDTWLPCALLFTYTYRYYKSLSSLDLFPHSTTRRECSTSRKVFSWVTGARTDSSCSSRQYTSNILWNRVLSSWRRSHSRGVSIIQARQPLLALRECKQPVVRQEYRISSE